MKRVCHLTSVHSSHDTRIFHKECVSLAAAGYDVYLVAPGESREERGVQVVGVGPLPVSRLKRITQMAKSVFQKALEIDADIYHLHDPELLPYVAKLKRRGKTVIFDCHEDILGYVQDKSWIPLPVRKPAAWLVEKYFRKALPTLDALIYVTPSQMDGLRELNNNIAMVTNYPIVDEKPSQMYRVSNEAEFRLVFAGGVTPQWNHESILRAIQPMDGVSYHVYGKGQQNYLDRLSVIDVAGRLVYHGHVSHDHVASALGSASVGMALCQPSKNTAGMLGSLGNTKLFEYMLNGLPVICTNFQLWEGIVEGASCGLCVSVDNVEEIAQAISYLRQHPAECKEMGRKGRGAVLREYNWKAAEKELLNLYEKA